MVAMKRHFVRGVSRKTARSRRGAAMVGFAIFLPIMLTLVLGTIELGSALRASNILNAAVREGGRLASMDFSDKVGDNETANQKVKRDIRNFVSAAGLDGTQVSVSIRHDGGTLDGQNFDLEDPANNLMLFRIRAVMPYSAVSAFPLNYMAGKSLRAKTVFRATRSSLAN